VTDERPPIEPAPEGASCAEHPSRSAVVTCPRCGSYCCLGCWHGPSGRCQACLQREALPPVPWADPSLPWPKRFARTLGDAVSPSSSATGFLRGHWRSALGFALLTALPLALLSGVIPFTHRLGFTRMQIAVLGEPSDAELALDVLQGMGMGLLFSVVKLLCLLVPYVSLVRAYGRPDGLRSGPATQVMLYRAWLLPVGGAHGLVLGLVLWALPLEPTQSLSAGVMALLSAMSLLPLMMLLWAMTATARAAGAGPFSSLAVVLVPFLALFFAEPMLVDALEPWLPSSAAMEEALSLAAERGRELGVSAQEHGVFTNPHRT
jgi:hypothetical protein